MLSSMENKIKTKGLGLHFSYRYGILWNVENEVDMYMLFFSFLNSICIMKFEFEDGL